MALVWYDGLQIKDFDRFKCALWRLIYGKQILVEEMAGAIGKKPLQRDMSLCSRGRYQGQGQVITSHIYCRIYLLVPPLLAHKSSILRDRGRWFERYHLGPHLLICLFFPLKFQSGLWPDSELTMNYNSSITPNRAKCICCDIWTYPTITVFLRNSGISTCNGRIAIVIAINTVNGKHKGFECDTERVSFTMLRILIAVQAL